MSEVHDRSRGEHLEWCKQRALACCREGDLVAAVALMMSDLSKHDETRRITNPYLLLPSTRPVTEGDRDVVVKWIEAFQ
jgi:hypothetical protein